MSVPPTTKDSDYLGSKSRIRIHDLREAKKRRQKWVMLTSYDTVSASIFEKAKIPVLLIGDSAGQTVLGYKSTLSITLDEMIPMAKAVSSSCDRALVIADLPFGSYQESPAMALQSASRFMKESGVHGVKMEGGKEYAEHVRLMTRAGIPVMAHIGFTPQSEHALSGFKIQGRGDDGERVYQDARALEAAGAFACVLEMTSSSVAKRITHTLSIPTIGIGAGPDCDAHVMVWQDMAGFLKPNSSVGGYLSGASGGAATSSSSGRSGLELNRVPKFVKKYANMSEILYKAAQEYAEDVASGIYPGEEHSYD